MSLNIINKIMPTWGNDEYITYSGMTGNRVPVFTNTESMDMFSQIDHTDGIGSKGMYAIQYASLNLEVLSADAFYMNYNDLIMGRALPYKMQAHLSVPNIEIAENIVAQLVTLCNIHNIVYTGGETSIRKEIEAFDISITMSGLFSKNNIKMNNSCEIEDTIYYLPSKGMHANGYTEAFKVLQRLRVERNTNLYELLFSDLKRNLLIPTDFTKTLSLDQFIINYSDQINGMMHITGGAFTKLRSLVGSGKDIILETLPNSTEKVFQTLWNATYDNTFMYSNFNCGVGFVVFTKNIDFLKEYPEFKRIGKVAKGTGDVLIRSQFDGKVVFL